MGEEAAQELLLQAVAVAEVVVELLLWDATSAAGEEVAKQLLLQAVAVVEQLLWDAASAEEVVGGGAPLVEIEAVVGVEVVVLVVVEAEETGTLEWGELLWLADFP